VPSIGIHEYHTATLAASLLLAVAIISTVYVIDPHSRRQITHPGHIFGKTPPTPFLMTSPSRFYKSDLPYLDLVPLLGTTNQKCCYHARSKVISWIDILHTREFLPHLAHASTTLTLICTNIVFMHLPCRLSNTSCYGQGHTINLPRTTKSQHDEDTNVFNNI
jgi:hypothetical protein